MKEHALLIFISDSKYEPEMFLLPLDDISDEDAALLNNCDRLIMFSNENSEFDNHQLAQLMDKMNDDWLGYKTSWIKEPVVIKGDYFVYSLE